MCEFVSWIEKGDHIYFLTHELIYNTPRGKLVSKRCSPDDLPGHGAIRLYFDLAQDEGKNQECTDFGETTKFPKQLVEAIKNGEMVGLGAPKELLTSPALAEYQKITSQALAEYQKITSQALAEYQKNTSQALAEYQKITSQALAEYQKIKAQTFWDLFADPANRNPAWR